MGLSKYISFPIFLLSFLVGLLFNHVLGIDKNVIYVYPTPENIEGTQYKDVAGNCFKYNMESVTCPANPNVIPVQSTTIHMPSI